MSISSESYTTPRQLSVSLKLGAVFLLLATLAAGSLYFSDKMHGGIVNIARIINQSGRLCCLSRQIVLPSVFEGE